MRIPVLLLLITTLSFSSQSESPNGQAEDTVTTLLSHVNIVDVENGEVLSNHYVLLENDYIKTISSEKLSGSFDEEIDATGKYLMPGLINMYTHVNEDNLILYLANGQTTVKDAPSHLTALGLREKVKRGEVLGPRVFAVGLRATGMPAPYQSQQPIRTAEEAIQQVREAKRLGYDGMFIYGSCDADTYVPILAEAQKQGIQISGHFPQNVSLELALNEVQKTFDNLTGLTRGGNLRMDKAQLINGLRRTGQAITPTLTVHRLWSLSHKNDSIYAAIPKEFIPNKMKANWLPIENGSGTYPHEKVAALIREMYQQGVKLFIGSDGGYPMVVNGFSYHDEIRNFSELGIPNEEILRIATLHAARALGYENLGLVKESYLADLLLLDENPLQDLSHLKKIAYVFAQGEPISKALLEEELQKLKNRLANPGNRFAKWQDELSGWEKDSVLHYELKNNDIVVGEEVIRIHREDDRNFTLESINSMEGPDGRQTYLFTRVRNRSMDSLFIKSITPEGTYQATISTTKTKAVIKGTAPFHGDFFYEESLDYGTLLLGPFTSRYYELDMVANYMLAMLLKRGNLQINQADQLPVLQIELNSEEFGKKLIVDDSEYTIYHSYENHYKVIYHSFSGYRTITQPSFVVDIIEDGNKNILEIKAGARHIGLR